MNSIFQTRGLIERLLGPCGPFAIVLAVISVIVFAFQCHAFRATPHIFKEIFKRFPSFAKCNAAINVAMGEVLATICAASFHCCPSRILATSWSPLVSRFSVGNPRQPNYATAAFCVPVSQGRSLNNEIVSAVASNTPERTPKPVCYWEAANYGQSVEFFTGKVDEVSYNRLSHDAPRMRCGLGRWCFSAIGPFHFSTV